MNAPPTPTELVAEDVVLLFIANDAAVSPDKVVIATAPEPVRFSVASFVSVSVVMV